MEVPLKATHLPFGTEEKTATPGAEISRLE